MTIYWKDNPEDFSCFLEPMYQVGQKITPAAAKKIATDIAYRGAGSVSPNPLVGCVLVDKNHCYVEADYHAKYGESHAEAGLLKHLEDSERLPLAVGGTLYLTLEPCAHTGKTPSCAKALVTTGIKKVICAHQDPNPLVNGKGFEILAQAGIDWEVDEEFALMSRPLIEAFTWNQRAETPYVALKVAQSLDGKSGHRGDSRSWVTNDRARQYGHWLRLVYDGILVGAHTVLKDNPTLNIRHPKVSGRSPKKVVFDPTSRGIQDLNSKVLNLLEGGKSDLIWICDVEKLTAAKIGTHENHGIIFMHWENSLEKTLKNLKKININSLLVEGGPTTWSKFLQAGLVNKVYTFQAMKYFGCQQTMDSTNNLSIENPIEMDFDAWITPLDDNILIESYPLERK